MPDTDAGDGTTVPPGLVVRNWLALALLVLGSFQMTGYLLGLTWVRGLGACSAASPFPKVFSDVRGLETFASGFTMVYETPEGLEVTETITPEYYQRLQGPYWRRNVYGAALSYGPRLPREIWETVFCYGLQPGGPMRLDFEIPADARRTRVVIETRTRGRDDRWELEPQCAE